MSVVWQMQRPVKRALTIDDRFGKVEKKRNLERKNKPDKKKMIYLQTY